MKYWCTALALCLILATGLEAYAQDAAPLYLTRAEAVMLLLKTSGRPIENLRNDGKYPDVIEGQWYVPYVMKAASIGMIDAEQRQGLVHPHKSVSRAEFLKMATIAFQLTTDIPHGYTDVPTAAWYRKYAGLAYRHRLFASSNQLQPELRVQHPEAVRVLTVLLKEIPGLEPRTEQQIADLLHRNDLPSLMTTPSGVAAPIMVPALQGTTFQATSRTMVKQAMLKLFRTSSTLAGDAKLDLLQRTNAERLKMGLPILRHNPLLSESAQAHAKDMHARGYFSHFTPEGLNYVERIRATGYMTMPPSCPCDPNNNLAEGGHVTVGPNYTLVKDGGLCECKTHFSLGENIAKGQLTPAQVMTDWMKSPNHKKNILQTEFEEIGIGIFGDIWVQNFGRVKLN